MSEKEQANTKTEDTNKEEKERSIREQVYFLAGIVYGALLGFFSGIYGNWFVDTYKEADWFPMVLGLLAGAFLAIIISMVYLIYRLTRKLMRLER
jgi:F0F1-type ATP synthase assembly protein I